MAAFIFTDSTPQTMEQIAPMIAMVGLTVMTAFIVWVVVTGRRRAEMVKAQIEMQTKLMERFGTSQEFLQYLQSDAGKKFLESATVQPIKPYGRILGSISAGVVLSFFGLGFLFLRNMEAPGEMGFTISGTVFLALGLGFLVSALIAYFLSKSWGLMNGQTNRRNGS